MKVPSLGLAIILGSLISQPVVLAEKITTRDGKTYDAASVQRVEPDGIILSYQPPGGGFGSAKLKFAMLSDKLQREYAFESQKADAFEANQAHAQQTLQIKFWSEYKDATNRVALMRIEEEKLAELEAEENARLQAKKAEEEQERIAKEADAKKAVAEVVNTNPYYEIGVGGPTGFVPFQYVPPKGGKYRPSLPKNQLPGSCEETKSSDSCLDFSARGSTSGIRAR